MKQAKYRTSEIKSKPQSTWKSVLVALSEGVTMDDSRNRWTNVQKVWRDLAVGILAPLFGVFVIRLGCEALGNYWPILPISLLLIGTSVFITAIVRSDLRDARQRDEADRQEK